VANALRSKRDTTRFVGGLLLLLIAVVAVLATWSRPAPPVALAVNGLLDLSYAESSPDRGYALAGEWQLRSGALLGPADVRGGQPVHVPGAWNGVRGSGTGVGTYWLHVRVPARWRIGEIVELYTPTARTASIVWVTDGAGAALAGPLELGTVSADASRHVPRIHHEFLRFPVPASRELTVVYEVSNFSHSLGGLVHAPVLAEGHALSDALAWWRVLIVLFVGLALFAAFHNITHYIYWPIDVAPLCLGIVCLAIATRALFAEEAISGWFTTWWGYQVALRGEYLSFYLSSGLLLPIVSAIFPQHAPWRISRVVLAICVLASISAIVLPSILASVFVRGFELFAVGLALYILRVLVRVVYLEDTLISRLLLVGAGAAVVLGTSDVLDALGVIDAGAFGYIGLTVFIGVQSLMVGLHYRQAHRDLEERTAEIERYNVAASRFVPHDLLRILGKKHISEIALSDNVEGKMAIMFADIRAFTTLSESMTPLESFEFINGLFAGAAPIIRERGGFIVKYIGDGMMAVFPTADDALRAAIDIQRALHRFNEARAERGRPRVKVGIGINYGDVMLGMVGEERRLQGDLLADAVNLASRVEGASKEYGAGILITRATLDALADPQAHALREVDLIAVKGKTQPVQVYEVFETDPPDLRQQKTRTAEDFQRAVEVFRAGKIDEAASLLRCCKDQAPDDPVVALYLDRCRLGIVPTGGVTVLRHK
jgi:adenylate cyclase